VAFEDDVDPSLETGVDEESEDELATFTL
jgi:hypothetical protein